jgi:hypothetical protein
LIILIIKTAHFIVTLSTITVAEDSSHRKPDPPGIWRPSFRCSSLYLIPKNGLEIASIPGGCRLPTQ